MSSPLAYINTNYTLLALSSSTTVQVTESTSDTNMKPTIEEDATSGKKMYIKSLYTMNLHLNMHLNILKKKWKDISNKYTSNILTYMNIYS